MPADYEELRRAAEARCPDCDAPLATQADYDGHKNGCQCRRCRSLCWRAWNGNSCEREPVDWRDRCLALRVGVGEAVEALAMLRERDHDRGVAADGEWTREIGGWHFAWKHDELLSRLRALDGREASGGLSKVEEAT